MVDRIGSMIGLSLEMNKHIFAYILHYMNEDNTPRIMYDMAGVSTSRFCAKHPLPGNQIATGCGMQLSPVAELDVRGRW